MGYVALGSNLGDSADILLDAMERLERCSAAPLARSSLWRTTPVDCPPGSPPFVNAVVGLALRLDETPESLLEHLLSLEPLYGPRERRAVNEPRLLDLDLIAFGNEVRNTPTLILPHPRAHQRAFVLRPLNEIAPSLVLPGLTRSIRELTEQLPDSDEMEPI